MLLFTNPVASAIIKMKILQYSIPFLLWTTGPGASLILTHNAPRESVMPISNWPKKEKTTAGIMISSVTRIPSAKFWLNKKYRICWVLSMIVWCKEMPKMVLDFSKLKRSLCFPQTFFRELFFFYFIWLFRKSKIVSWWI